jgi:hypothetical protein
MLTVTHPFVSLVPDAHEDGIIGPEDYNDNHLVTGTLPVSQAGVPDGGTTGQVLLKASDLDYDYEWSDQSSLDHGSLSGLADDDHTQYHTDARALTWLGTRSTADLPEGLNLYYTTARFDSAFAAKRTTDLAEGTNLYYTAARFNTAFAAKSTSDLAEGGNLYYTAERVDDRVAALLQEGSNIDLTYNDGADTLTVATSLTPTFTSISTNAGTDPSGANHHVFKTAGNVNRFGIGLIDNESGANSGSNLRIFTYADNGAFLADAIGFRRSDGAITTGNWQATRIGLTYGGTNADLSATGGASQYLKQSSAGAAVTVGTIPASDIASGAALSRTNDTNVTLTLGGTPTTALLASTSLTLGWSGQLSTARGGTGNSGFTDQSIIFSDGTKLTESPAGLTFVSSTSTLQVGGAILTSTTFNGEVYNKISNANSGSSAYAILRLQNDTANNLTLRLNSSTNSSNGGTNAATLQNTAGILRLFGSGGNGLVVNTSSNVGVGVVPVNKACIAGAVAIGSSYAGVSNAPSNGLLVEGQTIFGATSSFINGRVEIQGSDRVSVGFGGTKTATDGTAQIGFYVGATFSPTSSTVICTDFLMYPIFSPGTGITITNGYGIYIQTGEATGLGTVTHGTNVRIDNANYGVTSKTALSVANLACGYSDITPPTDGAIINGSVSIGASSNTYKLQVTGGDIAAMTAGKTVRIAQGSNACMGTGATMIAGVATVNTTAAATGDLVIVSRTAAAGTLGSGMPTVTIADGTSFTLTSSSLLETSTYSWWIVKAA